MATLTVSKLNKAIRDLKKKYREKGKSEDWLGGWERGFRRVYDNDKTKNGSKKAERTGHSDRGEPLQELQDTAGSVHRSE
jgi:hypothetical protein